MTSDNKELDVAPASQPPLSHPFGAEPASAVSGKAGIANAATFTPGPWRVDPQYPCDIQSGDGSLELACTCDAVLEEGEKPVRTVQFANAALIAAAPELFEALERIAGLEPETTFSHEARHGGRDTLKSLDATEVQGIARAALAKARA